MLRDSANIDDLQIISDDADLPIPVAYTESVSRQAIGGNSVLSSETSIIELLSQHIDFSFTLPSGYLLCYMVFNNSTAYTPNVKCGTSTGGSQVFSDQTLNASELTGIITNPIISVSDATITVEHTTGTWDEDESIDCYVLLRKVL